MLTGPPELIDEARVWSLHGMSRDAFRRYTAEGSWRYDVVLPGFKYNMADLQAAIGIQQLRKMKSFQERRRALRSRYDEAFAGLEEIARPVARPHVDHAWHLYVIRLRLEMLKIDRAEFIEELRELNIGASVHFIPIHHHRYYREKYGYRPGDLPVANRAFDEIISLPINPRMSDADAADVVEAVRSVVAAHRR